MLSGSALFKIVLIKPADYPHLAPDKGFCEGVFYFDPDSNGHFARLRLVDPQPSPVEVGEVVAALIKQTEPPARDKYGLSRQDRLDFVNRAEKIRVAALVDARARKRREGKDAIHARGLLSEAELTDLLEGDFSTIGRVLRSAGMIDEPPPITRQDDGANLK